MDSLTITVPSKGIAKIHFHHAAAAMRSRYAALANCPKCDTAARDTYLRAAEFFESLLEQVDASLTR